MACYYVPPPTSEEMLLRHAYAIAGLTLHQLVIQLYADPPYQLERQKGWVGQLIEKALGATAGSRAEPDFPGLGIELKTIPINEKGIPTESTFVNTISLLELSHMTWETSVTRHKLRRVLWVPIEADKSLSWRERHIGMPLLWSPNPTQEAVLKQDWCELTDMMVLGQLESITAHHGRYLQVRPKAQHNRQRRWGIAEDGSQQLTLPRGFYLRREFTSSILKAAYV